jgi:hypothetical protein
VACFLILLSVSFAEQKFLISTKSQLSVTAFEDHACSDVFKPTVMWVFSYCLLIVSFDCDFCYFIKDGYIFDVFKTLAIEKERACWLDGTCL